jgi:hypothetical protein
LPLQVLELLPKLIGADVVEGGGDGGCHDAWGWLLGYCSTDRGGAQYPNQTKNSPVSTGPNLAVVP